MSFGLKDHNHICNNNYFFKPIDLNSLKEHFFVLRPNATWPPRTTAQSLSWPYKLLPSLSFSIITAIPENQRNSFLKTNETRSLVVESILVFTVLCQGVAFC